jgi:flagellar hook-basal body complex protein FliE
MSMSLESIASIANVSIVDPAFGSMAAAQQQAGFSQMVSKGLGEVNQKLLSTQTDLQQLAVGDVQNLHQVMINLEEARMSFQLLMQVRNRVLEAYQDVMKMSV